MLESCSAWIRKWSEKHLLLIDPAYTRLATCTIPPGSPPLLLMLPAAFLAGAGAGALAGGEPGVTGAVAWPSVRSPSNIAAQIAYALNPYFMAHSFCSS